MSKGPSIHSLIHLYKRCVSKILENSQTVYVRSILESSQRVSVLLYWSVGVVGVVVVFWTIVWVHLKLKRCIKDQAFKDWFTSTRGVFLKF